MTILEVQNLTKVYSKESGIFHFDLKIESGDVVLLLGPNGAGKTTAFRGILGLTKVDYDRITVLQNDMRDNRLACMKKIGAMVSKPVFYEYLTGYENLKLLTHVYENITVISVNNILEKVGLTEAKDKPVSAYSSGMKQRLDLARAMIHNPQLLILDEPFNGMDIEAKYAIKKDLKAMQMKENIGIIISSHMVGDLENIANKVVILYKGNTLYNGPMTEIQQTGLTLEEFYMEKLNLFFSPFSAREMA